MRFQFNLKAILLLTAVIAFLAMMWPVFVDWSTSRVDWEGAIGQPLPEVVIDERTPGLTDAEQAEKDLKVGLGLLGRDWPEAAFKYFQRAVQLKPDSAEAQYRYSIGLNGLGLRPAVVHSDAAVQLAPENRDYQAHHKRMVEKWGSR